MSCSVLYFSGQDLASWSRQGAWQAEKSPSPEHQASPLGQGWVKARLGHQPMLGGGVRISRSEGNQHEVKLTESFTSIVFHLLFSIPKLDVLRTFLHDTILSHCLHLTFKLAIFRISGLEQLVERLSRVGF